MYICIIIILCFDRRTGTGALCYAAGLTHRSRSAPKVSQGPRPQRASVAAEIRERTRRYRVQRAGCVAA